MKLSETLNKTISDFCHNKFTGSTENHCAHFVCHVLEFDLGYDCKIHMNGHASGACIRVQELFAECPQVGEWDDSIQGLKIMFVTDKSNVSLTSHTMRNVPKKHVGIFFGGYVYHYSNTQDTVIRQTPKDFLNRFQKTYGGNQKLFFGTLPASARVPDPEIGTSPAPVKIKTQLAPIGPKPDIRQVTVSPETFDYYAKLPDVEEYYIARNTEYKYFQGLFQPSSKLNGPRYLSKNFFEEYGTVAGLLDVISTCESGGYFNRLNTYDRAAFTFGFFQLAAHTPNEHLILLFRRAVKDNPAFQKLFPNLKLVEGVLHRDLGTHTVSLETQYSRPDKVNERILKDFMSFLNSDGKKIDETELFASALLVHLGNTDNAFNQLQVSIAAQITMKKIRDSYSHWYNLNNVSDLICTAIADIHHHGRGTKTEVRNALASAHTVKDKVEELCKVGQDKYPERCKTLKLAIKNAEQHGYLGISVFDKASGLFKPNNGWPE